MTHRFGLLVAAGFAIGLLAILPLHAATPTTQASPTTDPAAWDDIDQRMIFFTVQLASVETSIDACNKALKAAGYKISLREDDAARYQKGNELMDRNAGGPVRWDEFYGKTAEKFFYNPAAPPGTLRLTVSVLKTNGRGDVHEPLPASQRPPQFDYIYRANANQAAQAQADIAKLAGKTDQLLARRRQLEAEQSGLWCKIAFRPVAGRELLGKPLYRFDLKTTDTGANAAQDLAAMQAAMDFLRLNNKLIESAEKSVDTDQAGFVASFTDDVAGSRAAFDAALMKQPAIVMDAYDPHTTLGKLEAVAKRMNDVAKNVADAYKLALDGDQANDDQRKDTFRAQLQESLMVYAEAVLAGDECVAQLAKEWTIVPNLEKAIGPESVEPITPAHAGIEQPFTSVEDVIAIIPNEALPKTGADWTDATAKAANDSLAKAVGHHCVVTIPLGEIQKWKEGWYTYSVIQVNGVTVHAFTSLSETEKTSLGGLGKDTAVSIDGTIGSRTRVLNQYNHWALSLFIDHRSISKETKTGSDPVSTPATGGAVGFNPVGTWIKPDTRAIVYINADGTFATTLKDDNHQTGQWTVEQNILTLTYHTANKEVKPLTIDGNDHLFWDKNHSWELKRVDAGAGAKKSSGAVSTPGKIDLLSLLDFKRDVLQGKWSRQDGSISCESGSGPQLRFPYRPPEEYDYTLEFSLSSADYGAIQLLTHNGTDVNWNLPGKRGTCCQFNGSVKDVPIAPADAFPRIQAGQRYVSRVEVRNGELRGYLDDKLVVSHKTDYHEFSPNQDYVLGDRSRLGVIEWWNKMTIYRAEVTEVSGKGTIVTESAATPPPLAMPAGAQLVSARWGGGSKWADVTPQVSTLLTAGANFRINGKVLASDPTPGWKKHLQIAYESGGKTFKKSLNEGSLFRMTQSTDPAGPPVAVKPQQGGAKTPNQSAAEPTAPSGDAQPPSAPEDANENPQEITKPTTIPAGKSIFDF